MERVEDWNYAINLNRAVKIINFRKITVNLRCSIKRGSFKNKSKVKK